MIRLDEKQYRACLLYTSILNVDLENFNLSHVPVYIMGEEQLSMYAMYMLSLIHILG